MTPAQRRSIAPYLTQRRLPLVRPVVSIDTWRPLQIEQIGTKPKQWFEAHDRSRWLFKGVGANRKRGGGVYLRGDDWAEVVASEVALLLGLPTAMVELATHKGAPGVISRTLVPRAALIHGNELLAGRYPDYGGADGRSDPRYTVDEVLGLVSAMSGPPDSHLPAESAFAGYLVLDALIGNTDRHHQNWAAIRESRRRLTLAPTFDHASSLGFLLSDEARLDMLAPDTDQSVRSYASKAGTPFQGFQSPLEAAMAAIRQLSPRERKRWWDRVQGLRDELEDVVALIPSHRMSAPARNFAVELMRHNQAQTADRIKELL